MAFLEVLTRCYRRPAALARNQASLRVQSDTDYTQTLLIDEVGIGVAAANARLADVEPTGEYVWILDDDDYCIFPDFVARLKQLATAMPTTPAVIVVRMDHGALGVLPALADWGSVPKEGGIGASALVTRRDVWLRHRDQWRSARYASDYDFSKAVLTSESHIVWIDWVASAISRRSIGAAEGGA
jgi:glycosyltransferase involved in cell wall biosynthesis